MSETGQANYRPVCHSRLNKSVSACTYLRVRLVPEEESVAIYTEGGVLVKAIVGIVVVVERAWVVRAPV